MDSLYQETLLAYSKNTSHERGLPDATHRASDTNALCGDAVTFEFIVPKKHIIRIGHKTNGCVVSKASTAWLAEQINGKTKKDAIKFIDALIENKNDYSLIHPIFLSAIQNPTRAKCVTLPWHIAYHALTHDDTVVITHLRTVYDPELPINIFDLGLIYNISWTDDQINILMTLTSPNCPVAETFPTQVGKKIFNKMGVPTKVTITFDPPWTIERATADARILLQR